MENSAIKLCFQTDLSIINGWWEEREGYPDELIGRIQKQKRYRWTGFACQIKGMNIKKKESVFIRSRFFVRIRNSSSNLSRNGRYGKEQEENKRRNLSNSNKWCLHRLTSDPT